jgi:hypothetical protein
MVRKPSDRRFAVTGTCGGKQLGKEYLRLLKRRRSISGVELGGDRKQVGVFGGDRAMELSRSPIIR